VPPPYRPIGEPQSRVPQNGDSSAGLPIGIGALAPDPTVSSARQIRN